MFLTWEAKPFFDNGLLQIGQATMFCLCLSGSGRGFSKLALWLLSDLLLAPSPKTAALGGGNYDHEKIMALVIIRNSNPETFQQGNSDKSISAKYTCLKLRACAGCTALVFWSGCSRGVVISRGVDAKGPGPGPGPVYAHPAC